MELSKAGMAIVMVSSELPEILAVSDRILVMSEGSLTGEIPIEIASENNILKAAIPKKDNP
jgi:ribose transport system ATP-binding protein